MPLLDSIPGRYHSACRPHHDKLLQSLLRRQHPSRCSKHWRFLRPHRNLQSGLRPFETWSAPSDWGKERDFLGTSQGGRRHDMATVDRCTNNLTVLERACIGGTTTKN